MGEELISIIVPVYNVDNYLRDCLDSILGQTYTNIEIICINDGSTDNSLEILNEYKDKDSRITVISQMNGGLSAARNAGLEVAKGKWVTFVDSDDCIHNKFIERTVFVAKNTGSSLVIARYKTFSDINDLGINELKYDQQIESKSIIGNGLDIFKLSYTQNDGVTLNTAWGKLYSRSLFSDLRFPCGKIHEDEFTTYKTFITSSRVTFLDDTLYFYRTRPGSIMKKLKPEDQIEVLDAFKNRILAFKKRPDLQSLAADDYLIRISELFFQLRSTSYFNTLVDRYRKEYSSLFILLNQRSKAERGIAFISPWLYCKIKELLGQ